MLGVFLTNKTVDLDAGGFCVLHAGAVISDVIGGHYNNLSEIRWVGEDFLIAGHAGVETNFSSGCPDLADGFSVEYAAILQHQDCSLSCGRFQLVQICAKIRAAVGHQNRVEKLTGFRDPSRNYLSHFR